MYQNFKKIHDVRNNKYTQKFTDKERNKNTECFKNKMNI